MNTELSSVASNAEAVAEHIAMLEQRAAAMEQRIAVIDKHSAQEAGDKPATSTNARLSALERRIVRKGAADVTASAPTSKIETLPLELRLLIAEQLDYGSLKRLE